MRLPTLPLFLCCAATTSGALAQDKLAEDEPRLVTGQAAPQAEAPTEAAPPASGATPEPKVAQLVPQIPGPLELRLEFGTALQEMELRDALSRELGVNVLLEDEATLTRISATITIAMTQMGSQTALAVSVTTPSGAAVTRVVDAPEAETERISLARLLVPSVISSLPPGALRPAPDLPSLPPPPTAPETTPAPSPPRDTEPQEPELHRVPAVVSLFYPIASNATDPVASTTFSLNLGYGKVFELEGLSLGVFQKVDRNFSGGSLSLLGHVSGASASGFQLSLGFNAAENMQGLFGSAVNLAHKKATGLQVGAVNLASKKLEGAQVGLGVNIAGDLTGAQVGALNIAKKVKGTQIGLLNVAEDIDGVPLAPISVTESGGVHPMIWASNSSYLNLGLRFATKHTYTFVSFSFHSSTTHGEQIGPGVGVGGIIPVVADRLFVDVDLSETYLVDDQLRELNLGTHLIRLRAAVRYQALRHLSFFAGGGFTGAVEWTRNFFEGAPPDSYAFDSRGEMFAGVQF